MKYNEKCNRRYFAATLLQFCYCAPLLWRYFSAMLVLFATILSNSVPGHGNLSLTISRLDNRSTHNLVAALASSIYVWYTILFGSTMLDHYFQRLRYGQGPQTRDMQA